MDQRQDGPAGNPKGLADSPTKTPGVQAQQSVSFGKDTSLLPLNGFLVTDHPFQAFQQPQTPTEAMNAEWFPAYDFQTPSHVSEPDDPGALWPEAIGMAEISHGLTFGGERLRPDLRWHDDAHQSLGGHPPSRHVGRRSAPRILQSLRLTPQGEDSNGALSGVVASNRRQDAPTTSRERPHNQHIMEGAGVGAGEERTAITLLEGQRPRAESVTRSEENGVSAAETGIQPEGKEQRNNDRSPNVPAADEGQKEPDGLHAADAKTSSQTASGLPDGAPSLQKPASSQLTTDAMDATMIHAPMISPSATTSAAAAISALSLDIPAEAPATGSKIPLQDPVDPLNMGMALNGGLDSSLHLQNAVHGLPDLNAHVGDPSWNLNMGYPDAPAGLGAAFSDMPQSEYDTQGSQAHAAFAKLEFNDGAFYMTTYAVELGRDMRAFKLAKQHAIETEIQNKEQKERSNSGEKLPETPIRQTRSAGHASAARSFVSESGGIIGEDDELLPLSKRKRRKSQKSKSDESVDSQVLRKNSLDILDDSLGLQSRATGTVDPNVTARLDPAAHMGDPSYVPLIPIHPPNLFTDPKSSGKGISRKHVKIAYNFDSGKFEMQVTGRNGAFLDAHHYQRGSVVPLKDGSLIQIGGVPVKFRLPNQLLNDDGEPEPSESVSGRMSFSFEDGQGGSVIASDSGAPSFESSDEHPGMALGNGYQYSEEEDEESAEQSDEEDEEDEESDASDPPPTEPRFKARRAIQKQPAPVKRGPGRPPSKKTALKIRLKMGSKPKADVPSKARGKERERETTGQKAVKAVPRIAVKETGEKKPKESSKQPDKEPGKDSGAADSKPVRIARDESLQNGVGGINIKDLPPGFVIPPRKKGPGRPPKDGIMSKRERQLLLKAAREHEKAIRLGLDPAQIPTPETKPRLAPRRNSKGELIEADASNATKSGFGGDDKGERAPRPPRSPSPEMRIEDYSEEQLQRPTANYVILIHEAISNSSTKKLNLQQIYSAIERRWPFFKFKVTSNGWQSSVRHNLGQHPAFRQVEKDGKGWLWGIAEGVPIERERKKKATPPPQLPPHQSASYPAHYPFGGYQAGRPGFNPPSGFALPGQYQANRPPTFVPPTAAAHSAAAKQSMYSSPYDTGGKGTGASSMPHGLPNFSSSSHLGLTPTSSHALPPTSRTPPAGQQQGSKWQQPSADLIETFRKVFVGTSIQQANGGMDEETATRIVDNAIRRVLDPSSMVGVPLVRNELAVQQAFESCLQRSNGPPKRISPGEPMPIVAGATARSIAHSAAITATAPVDATAAAMTGASTASTPPVQPEPERPAAKNLMTMLAGAPSAQAAATAPNPSPANAAVEPIAPILDTKASAANGTVTPIETARSGRAASPLRPAVEPLTPPAAAPPSLAADPSMLAAPEDTSQPSLAGTKRSLESTTSETVDIATKKLKIGP